MTPTEIMILKNKHDNIIKELEKLYRIYMDTKIEQVQIGVAENIRDLLFQKMSIDRQVKELVNNKIKNN